MDTLLLFDIDGTLVDTAGAGLRALRAALLDEFGLREREAEFPPLDLAGSTDGGVARQLFAAFGIALNAENLERFYARYHVCLEAEMAPGGDSPPGRLLPGVRRLLERLAGEEPAGRPLLGLLTGNIARGAWTKVGRYGLAGYFPFGAFGDDHHDRDQLGPVALDRAERHAGRRHEPRRVLVIGDTPKDIRCARACGARAVAVATGRFAAGDLAAHDPDHVCETLEDADAFVAMMRRLADS